MTAKRTQRETAIYAPERAAQPSAFFNVREAAAKLGVSVPTIWRRVKDKSLVSVQFGGKGCSVRIPVEALSSFAIALSGNDEQPAQKSPSVVVGDDVDQVNKLSGPLPNWMK